MGLFDRLRTISRGTSRPPRPIDVGRAMLTAVDAQMVTAADGRSLVANHVTVRLAAPDIDTTCPNKDLLIDELVDALRAHADWRGMDLGGEPSVMITIDDGAASGLLEVSARVKTGAQLPPPVPTPAASAVPAATDASAADAVPIADDAGAAVVEGAAPSESDPVAEPVMSDAEVAPPEMPIADETSPNESDPASMPLDAAAQLAALVAEEDHLDDGDAADDVPVPPIHSADDVRALLDTAPVEAVSAIGALVADDGTRYPIGRTALRIGRMSDNDVVVHHAHVSRYHAEIRNDGGRAILVDLGSTNGTALNGRRTDTATTLTHGDKITLGDTTLRFESV
ncbi:MAG: FhaA domain-containing protein [Ilumatobacteraceae bacterium]